MRVPCPEALTVVSQMAATSSRRKGKENIDDGELEPAETHLGKIGQGATKNHRLRESGKLRDVHR